MCIYQELEGVVLKYTETKAQKVNPVGCVELTRISLLYLPFYWLLLWVALPIYFHVLINSLINILGSVIYNTLMMVFMHSTSPASVECLLLSPIVLESPLKASQSLASTPALKSWWGLFCRPILKFYYLLTFVISLLHYFISHYERDHSVIWLSPSNWLHSI